MVSALKEKPTQAELLQPESSKLTTGNTHIPERARFHGRPKTGVSISHESLKLTSATLILPASILKSYILSNGVSFPSLANSLSMRSDSNSTYFTPLETAFTYHSSSTICLIRPSFIWQSLIKSQNLTMHIWLLASPLLQRFCGLRSVTIGNVVLSYSSGSANWHHIDVHRNKRYLCYKK